MKNEWAALHGQTKLSYSRKQCDACQKETIHHGVKCLSCGHCGRISGGSGKRRFANTSLRRQAIYKQHNADKRAYYQRLAAESRAKFEGKG